jgi:hypothetical protein
MMKNRYIGLVVSVLLTLACGVQASASALPTSSPSAAPMPTVLHHIITPVPQCIGTVNAEQALRLRDLPEGGGFESKELLLLPNGAKFSVVYSLTIRDTSWSYGSFTDENNVSWMGFVATRYLKGDCIK